LYLSDQSRGPFSAVFFGMPHQSHRILVQTL
jgi:hypothetical protein